MPKARRTKIGGQFAPRTIEMLRSPAMRVLSLSARRVLERIEIELADHGGTENGMLPVTYEDFCNFGMDRHAIAPAIREAVALGFVEVTEVGRAGNAEFRVPSKYRLTFRHTDRTNPTDEWQAITTVGDARRKAAAARSAKTRRFENDNSSGEKRHVSVGETHTDNAKSPVGKTPTTVAVGETPTTLDISGEGKHMTRVAASAWANGPVMVEAPGYMRPIRDDALWAAPHWPWQKPVLTAVARQAGMTVQARTTAPAHLRGEAVVCGGPLGARRPEPNTLPVGEHCT